ncbi:hypothetical protein MMC25_008049 [Agyrium rufum]|nr:hypothetical protein [Agyrium rufum]
MTQDDEDYVDEEKLIERYDGDEPYEGQLSAKKQYNQAVKDRDQNINTTSGAEVPIASGLIILDELHQFPGIGKGPNEWIKTLKNYNTKVPNEGIPKPIPYLKITVKALETRQKDITRLLKEGTTEQIKAAALAFESKVLAWFMIRRREESTWFSQMMVTLPPINYYLVWYDDDEYAVKILTACRKGEMEECKGTIKLQEERDPDKKSQLNPLLWRQKMRLTRHDTVWPDIVRLKFENKIALNHKDDFLSSANIDGAARRQWSVQEVSGIDLQASPSANSASLVEFRARHSRPWLWVGNARTSGTVLNLQVADTAIFFDPFLREEQRVQTVARAHRLGQRNTVNAYAVVSRKNGYDTGMVDEMERKASFTQILATKLDQPMLERLMTIARNNQRAKRRKEEDVSDDEQVPLLEIPVNFAELERLRKRTIKARNKARAERERET